MFVLSLYLYLYVIVLYLFPPAGAVGRPFPSVSVRVARFEPGAADYTVLAEADGSGACTVTPGCENQVGGKRD